MTSRRSMLKAAAGVLALTTAGTAVGAPAHASPPSTMLDPRKLQAALDAITAAGASGALAEVRDTGQLWRGVSGVAELGTEQPVPVGGRFRIGSTTKAFVATTVLQLVGEQRIGLDDPVEHRLPGTVPGGDRVTVRHLLQHTSGVPNYTNTPQFRQLYGSAQAVSDLRYRTWTPQELLALVAGLPLLFEPGTSWLYSNTNYILLGLLIEQVTDNGYASEIERRILRPLGLCDTKSPGTDPTIAGPHSHGYLPLERDGSVEPIDITTFNPTVTGASGEIVSTATDLNHFLSALMTGRLLRPAQLDAMRTIWPTGRKDDYGLGLQTRLSPGGTRLWGHGGEIFGYDTYAWSTEDGSRQLTVSLNPWGDGDVNAPMDELLTAAFGPG